MMAEPRQGIRYTNIYPTEEYKGRKMNVDFSTANRIISVKAPSTTLERLQDNLARRLLLSPVETPKVSISLKVDSGAGIETVVFKLLVNRRPNS